MPYEDEIEKILVEVIIKSVEKLLENIKEKTKRYNCDTCKWYSDDKFCEVGSYFMETLTGIHPKELPRYIDKKRRELDNRKFDYFHLKIHKIFGLGALIGFCDHIIKTLYPLILYLKIIKIILEENKRLVMRFIEAVKHYAKTEFYNESKDRLLAFGLNKPLEEIYRMKDELLNKIDMISKITDENKLKLELDETIKYAKNLVVVFTHTKYIRLRIV